MFAKINGVSMYKMYKNLSVILIALALSIAGLPAHSQDSPLIVSPASGFYPDSAQFDLMLLVAEQGTSIDHAEYYLNGQRVTRWLSRCMSRGYTENRFPFMTCKGGIASILGAGRHELGVEAYLADGRMLSSQVYYDIIPTAPTQLFEFALPSKSPMFDTGIMLEPYYEYEVSGTGEIAVWPQNSDFPVSGVSGNGLACNYSTCLVPGAPTGALVAKIGDGEWFVIDETHVVRPYYPARLYLSVNDRIFEDNVGSFDIRVKRLQP
jgi:hypothetical protein